MAARFGLSALVIAGIVARSALAASAGTAGPSVQVVDGNTLLVGGARHVLYAIAAPALGENCMVRGAVRDCGLIARASLMDLTAGARVACETVSSAATDRRSRCRANGYDLSEGMVHTGWARALAGGPRRFHTIMGQAQTHQRGMWRRK